jgi:hypothetical protein
MLVLLDEGGCPIAHPAHPWDRLLMRLRAHRLDLDLARGASPDATVAMALRAQMLVSAAVRRDLARSAQRIVTAAIHTSPQGCLPVPICRDRVRDAAGEFAELTRRLLAAGPVTARGVAQASLLLSDARGPLYHRANPGDLRSMVREAAGALEPAERLMHGTGL